MGRKFYRVKKNWGRDFIGLKKNWVENFIGLKKFGSEVWFGQIIFWSSKICLCYVAGYCLVEQQQHRVSLVGGGGLEYP